MTIEDIKQGESEGLEFKREFPDKERKVLKTIVAFANGNGGNVVIGVDDETLKIALLAYQKQKNLRTVQGEIERVLTSINNNILNSFLFYSIEINIL